MVNLHSDGGWGGEGTTDAEQSITTLRQLGGVFGGNKYPQIKEQGVSGENRPGMLLQG